MNKYTKKIKNVEEIYLEILNPMIGNPYTKIVLFREGFKYIEFPNE